MGKGPLVKVQIGKNRWVKMYQADAIAKGLLPSPRPSPKMGEGVKERMQAENKMREAPENKGAATAGEDFTKIPGVGRATASELHARGILTFDQLAASDLGFLQQGKVRQAIEEYFAGETRLCEM